MASLSTTPEKLVREMLGGSRGALARLISLAEGGKINTIELLAGARAGGKSAAVVGITGPPGAGKSTLTDKLVKKIRSSGRKVGVIAVDPSSPFTGGALLGDRVRMGSHSDDEGVFIRSLGSRGSLGGLSRATGDIIKLMEAFGAGCVLVETVGVGQSELDIVGVADTVVVVLVPESGDSIQTMKAGIMEIGDVFVVNKSDRKDAGALAAEIQSTLSIRAGADAWQTPVVLTKAVDGEGVAELADAIEKHGEHIKKSGILEEKRRDRIKKDLMDETNRILASFAEDSVKNCEEGMEIVSSVLECKVAIPEGAKRIASLVASRGSKI